MRKLNLGISAALLIGLSAVAAFQPAQPELKGILPEVDSSLFKSQTRAGTTNPAIKRMITSEEVLWDGSGLNSIIYSTTGAFNRETSTINDRDMTLVIPAGLSTPGNEYVLIYNPINVEKGTTYTFAMDVEGTAASEVVMRLAETANNSGSLSVTNVVAQTQVTLNEENGLGQPLSITGEFTRNMTGVCILLHLGGTEGESLTFNNIKVSKTVYTPEASDYIELHPTYNAEVLPENFYADYYYVPTEGTYVGISGSSISQIVGNCETLSIPSHFNMDGKILDIYSFGDWGSFDWSRCPNLKELHLEEGIYLEGSLNESALTDIYAESTDIKVYRNDGLTTNLHLPITVTGRPSGYDGIVTLVGDETLDRPEPASGNTTYMYKMDESNWIGMQFTEEGWIVTEFITDGNTMTVPMTVSDYRVTTLTSDYSYLFNRAHNLRVLDIRGISTINFRWSNTPITDVYLENYRPYLQYSAPSNLTVHCLTEWVYNSCSNNDYWRNATLVPEGWEFPWITVDVKRPGEFAQTYLEANNRDWTTARNVKITGKLNDIDLGNIKNLTGMMILDLTEADIARIPDNFLANHRKIQEVRLPESCTYIGYQGFASCTKLAKIDLTNMTGLGNSAFNGCTSLKDVIWPTMLHSIGQSVFQETGITSAEINGDLVNLSSSLFYQCNNLSSVNINAPIEKIYSSVFYYCTSLSEITLPETLKEFESSAFAYSGLTSITVPEGVTKIGQSAFRGCDNLAQASLPSTLKEIGSYMFYDCPQLTEVKCKAVAPPTASGDFTNGMDLTNATLYVTPFSVDVYRDAQYWSAFYIIQPLIEPVEYIYVERNVGFNISEEDNIVLQGNPTIHLGISNKSYSVSGSYYNNYYYAGEVTVEGNGTLSAGVVEIDARLIERGGSYDTRPTLINHADKMRTDALLVKMELEANTWHFITLPYDVTVEDIYGTPGTYFVIRSYDGASRAEGGTANWTDLKAGDVMEAGKGYIISATNVSESSSSQPATVVFPSRNTTTKNNIFRTNSAIVPLEEYISEFAHNRSWNLVGNPYPAYYRLSELMDDFTAPITIWRGSSYQAYSPVDDDLILRPYESFFVQRPLDKENITFGETGRCHFTEICNENFSTGYKAPAIKGASERNVFNFSLADSEGKFADRTRVVFNADAKAGYESERDAVKFFNEFSTEGDAQIFVNADGLLLDICERPEGSLSAVLGIRGAGEFTLSMAGRNIEGWRVTLTDRETGLTADITDTPYVFTSEKSNDARFELTFSKICTGVAEIFDALDPATEITVSAIDGTVVYCGAAGGFTLPESGIFIVRANGESMKVMF